MKKNFKDLLIHFLFIILGNFTYAFGVMAFIESKGLITGGVTGISLFLHYKFDWNASYIILCFNAVFFVIGFLVLGKRFALSTLVSSLAYPICVFILEFLDLSAFAFDDIWLNIIAGGVIIGAGLGMIMRMGGSTGGMDIPALIIHKYFPFITVGTCVTVLDILILSIQLTMFDLSFFVYGAVLAIIYSLVIDKVMLAGRTKIEIMIVSKYQDKISQAILHDLDRGVTLLHSKTGYLQQELETILTIVDVRELSKVKALIYGIDKNAFIVFNRVNEVSGRGFSEDKVYEKIEENEEKTPA